MTNVFRGYDEYYERYSNLRIERSGDGVLELAMHTDGAEPVFNGSFYEQLASSWNDVGNDLANKAVVYTSLGGEFLAQVDDPAKTPEFDLFASAGADRLDRAQRHLLANMLDVEAPIVAAVPGPATIHPEFVLCCDLILAAPEAILKPGWAFALGFPAAGGAALWLHAQGPVRGRAILYGRDEFSAEEAHALGIVGEVVPRERLLERAREEAQRLATLPELTRRYTRRALTQGTKESVLGEIGYGNTLIALAARAQAEAQRE